VKKIGLDVASVPSTNVVREPRVRAFRRAPPQTTALRAIHPRGSRVSKLLEHRSGGAVRELLDGQRRFVPKACALNYYPGDAKRLIA